MRHLRFGEINTLTQVSKTEPVRSDSPFHRLVCRLLSMTRDFPGGSDGKASAYNLGDLGLIPGFGRSSGEGNGNPLRYSCLENPMDRGAW